MIRDILGAISLFSIMFAVPWMYFFITGQAMGFN